MKLKMKIFGLSLIFLSYIGCDDGVTFSTPGAEGDHRVEVAQASETENSAAGNPDGDPGANGIRTVRQISDVNTDGFSPTAELRQAVQRNGGPKFTQAQGKRRARRIEPKTDLVGPERKTVRQENPPPKQQETKQPKPRTVQSTGTPSAQRKVSVITDEVVPKPAQKKQVDVLVVVDASASMDRFLKNVPHTFDGFTSKLSEYLDWSMIFVNTDHGNNFFLLDILSRDGRPFRLEDRGIPLDRYILTNQTPNHERIFINTIGTHYEDNWYRNRRRMDSDSTRTRRRVDSTRPPRRQLSPPPELWREQPLLVIRSFLINYRQDMLRKNADMAILIMTDGDEALGLSEVRRTRPGHVTSDFYEFHKDQKRLLVYSISIRPEVDQECQKEYGKGLLTPDEDTYSHFVSGLVQRTGGVGFSLCAPNFVPLAETMGEDFLYPL